MSRDEEEFWENYCKDKEGHINPPDEGHTPYHQKHIEALSSRLRHAFDRAFRQWMRSHPKACQLIVGEAFKSVVADILAADIRESTHSRIQAEEATDMIMTDVRALLRNALELDEQSYAEFSESAAHYFNPPRN
jgi:hypothetical protein